ncbi:MAG: transglycosylase SLT domain-containing protein [Deltaproteobacteria bacterium]|nr:transglycosylase SLT domain-containing protein [Deltaproteobacteria bacterium]
MTERSLVRTLARPGARALILGLLLVPAAAAGDIYRFIDENGVAHFTNVPPDRRYKLVIREGRPRGPAPETSGRAGRQASLSASERTRRYDRVIHEAARRHRVDPRLVRAVIKAESDFRPDAVSPKGAQGLMQLMPGTARRVRIADSFDPQDNVEGGVRYLRYLIDLFRDDLVLALAAYNAGEQAVLRYKTIPPFRETREYVDRVLRYLREYHAKGL